MEKICSDIQDSNNENENISDNSIKNKSKKKDKKTNSKKKVKKKKEEPLREIRSLFDMEYFRDIPKYTFDHDIVFARFILFMKKSFLLQKINYCRKNNIRFTRNMYLKEDELENIADEANTEESAIRYLMNDENRSTLKLALKDLSIAQRNIICYFYYEKMDIEEIAKELEISIQSVYKTKSRAEKKLKKLFIFYGGKFYV